MIYKSVSKFSATIAFLGVIIFFIYSLHFGNRFNKNLFRLSSSQVYGSLDQIDSQCNKLTDCKLLSGDILIRRYITKRTWLIDKLAHPYFTHSAFYLENDKLVEAVGTEKYSKDDIQINTLSTSDWFNSDLENFVIIRPKNYSSKLDNIKNDLKDIANDPDYTFGLPKPGQKRTTCSDIIFRQLINKQIITVSNEPSIITPDYLFWLAINNPTYFKIIGYNISQ